MILLKQSTAVTLKYGPFLDDTDGKTEETSLTISQADVRLSKNGGNIAQKNDTGSGAHDELGYYDIDLDATDTNTLGVLDVAVHESGALPVRRSYMVVPANVYDSLVSNSAYLFTNVDRANTAQSGSATTITLDASANATDDYYNGAVVRIVSGTGAGQSNIIKDYVGSTKVATVYRTYATSPDNTSVFHILPFGADLVEESDVQFDVLTDTTITGLSSQTVFNLTAGSADNDAYNGATVVITDQSTSTQKAVGVVDDYTGATKTVTLSAAPAFTVANGDLITIFASPAGTSAPTAAAIRTEIDSNSTQLAAIVTDTGTTLPNQISGLNNISTSQVNAEVDQALQDYDPPTKAEMDAKFDALKDFDPASDTVDVGKINGNATAAVNLALAASSTQTGTATSTTLTTTTMSTDLSEATDNHYNGRLLVFTTGNLTAQATTITDYDGATKLLTFNAVTEAPVANDTFVIV